MTRSEAIQEAIDVQRSRIAFEDDTYPKAQDKAILDLLLLEKERSDGCYKCNGVLSVNDALYFEDGKAGTVEYFARFCPNCGRSLTEGENV